jgi:hypothetical protein
MQDLEHDGRQSGLRYRGKVGVDLPGDAVRSEQTVITRRTAVHLRVVVATRGLLEVSDDAATQPVHAHPSR